MCFYTSQPFLGEPIFNFICVIMLFWGIHAMFVWLEHPLGSKVYNLFDLDTCGAERSQFTAVWLVLLGLLLNSPRISHCLGMYRVRNIIIHKRWVPSGPTITYLMIFASPVYQKTSYVQKWGAQWVRNLIIDEVWMHSGTESA